MSSVITSKIEKLPANRGGYHFVRVDTRDVAHFETATRFVCNIDEQLEFQCGLCHTGDGHYYIVLSKDKIKKLNKSIGDTMSFTLRKDPNPLGAEIPEAMQILMDQDPVLRAKFDSITDGKKRGIIHYISSTKNLDLQVERAIMMLEKYGR